MFVCMHMYAQELCETFVSGIAIILEAEEYGDMKLREELLAEALASLDEHHLTSGKVRGTVLGSTIVGFPAGDKLIREARLMHAKAKSTNEFLAPFNACLDDFHKQIGTLTSCILASPENVFQSLLTKARECGSKFEGRSICVVSHAPSPDTVAIKEAMKAWLSTVFSAYATLLKPVLRLDLKVETLDDWNTVCAASASRCQQCFVCTEVMGPMMQDTALLQNVKRCQSLASWLPLASALFIEGKEISLDELCATQAGLRLQLPGFLEGEHSAAVDVATGFSAMMNSQVFEKDGAYTRRVSATLVAKGLEVVGPIAEVFQSMLPATPLRVVEFENMSVEDTCSKFGYYYFLI